MTGPFVNKVSALLFGGALLFLCGCSTSTVQYGSMRAHNTRWFWSTTDFSATVTDTNGVSVTIGLKSSNTQSDALAAVAEGVARGLKP